MTGGRVLLALVATAVSLAMVEGGLRLTEYSFLRYSYEWPAGYFQSDPVLGVDHTPGRPPATFAFRGGRSRIFTNSLGCFDQEYRGEHPYLLVVGDSSAWGYAELAHKWTSHLERLSGVRTLKCGVSGTGPRFQMLKARKVIEQIGVAPAVILVLYDSWNDFNDDVVFPGYTVVGGQRVNTLKALDLRSGATTRYTVGELDDKYRGVVSERGWKDAVRRHSVLATLLDGARNHLGQDAPAPPSELGPLLTSRYGFYLWDVDPRRYPWVQQALESHLENIRDFKRMADRSGARFVFLAANLPREGLHGHLRQVLERELPYFLDVLPDLERRAEGRRIYYRFDNHWNRLGNRLAGEAIHGYLRDVGILPLPENRASAPET